MQLDNAELVGIDPSGVVHAVRGAVAFRSTAGLSRGVVVRSTGSPVTVPVGVAVLGHYSMLSATRKTTVLHCPTRR